ncbi:MAG TPA: hypothetical protein VGG14_17240, partial [Candidatus Sulfotelmatobacter sp.]
LNLIRTELRARGEGHPWCAIIAPPQIEEDKAILAGWSVSRKLPLAKGPRQTTGVKSQVRNFGLIC